MTHNLQLSQQYITLPSGLPITDYSLHYLVNLMRIPALKRLFSLNRLRSAVSYHAFARINLSLNSVRKG